MNEVDLDKKLKGYRITYKNKHELTRDIGDGAFRVNEFLIDIHDWDIRHKNRGLVNISLESIAKYFGYSTDTAKRRLDELADHNSIKILKKDWIEIPNFYIYHTTYGQRFYKKVKERQCANVQQEIAVMKEILAELQINGGVNALIEGKSNFKVSRDPFKDNSNNSSYNEDLSDEELDQIAEEIDKEGVKYDY